MTEETKEKIYDVYGGEISMKVHADDFKFNGNWIVFSRGEKEVARFKDESILAIVLPLDAEE